MNRRDFIGGGVVFGAGVVAYDRAVAQSFYATRTPKVGFIFIGAGWCPYCKLAAPVLAQLARQSDIPVLTVSLDGKTIAPFEDVLHDPHHPLIGQSPRIPRTLLVGLEKHVIIGSFDGFKSKASYIQNLRALVVTALKGGGV